MKLKSASGLIIPGILIAAYAYFLFFLGGSIPSSADLISHASSLYERFGYEIVFIGSLLESLVIVNLFAPGALTVGLGAIFARSGDLNLTLAVLAAVLGAMVGYIIDFTLGYFGFSQIMEKFGLGGALDHTRKQIDRFGFKSFAIGFIHPDIGSILSLSVGTLRFKFKKFAILAFFSTLAWFSFWGILIFALGNVFLVIITKHALVVILLVTSIWFLTTAYGNIKNS